MHAWTQTSINRHARFLDCENRGNDVGRHRRRYRHHDARLGLLGGDSSVLRGPGAARQLADCCEKISSLSLLGDYYCPHDIRHDNGGFRRSLVGIGYTGGSSLLLICLMATLGLWYWALGSISVDTINTPKVEVLYWAAITFSQTLGTALGDWTADSTGLGHEGGALVFGAALAVVAAACYWTNVSRVTLFWTAFILTPQRAGSHPGQPQMVRE